MKVQSPPEPDAMKRSCIQCGRSFTHQELADVRSKNPEAVRAADGLPGVCFLAYACPDCGASHLYVDVLPLIGEDVEAFRRRRSELAAVVNLLDPGDDERPKRTHRRPAPRGAKRSAVSD